MPQGICICFAHRKHFRTSVLATKNLSSCACCTGRSDMQQQAGQNQANYACREQNNSLHLKRMSASIVQRGPQAQGQGAHAPFPPGSPALTSPDHNIRSSHIASDLFDLHRMRVLRVQQSSSKSSKSDFAEAQQCRLWSSVGLQATCCRSSRHCSRCCCFFLIFLLISHSHQVR